MKIFQKKRLLKLADFLSRRVPEKHFHMGRWGMSGNLSLRPRECNTSGCALGWATVLFKHQGYTMGRGGPHYCGTWGLSSAVLFFGIPENSVYKLFFSDVFSRGLTAKQVARRIRREVKRLSK